MHGVRLNLDGTITPTAKDGNPNYSQRDAIARRLPTELYLGLGRNDHWDKNLIALGQVIWSFFLNVPDANQPYQEQLAEVIRTKMKVGSAPWKEL